MLTIVNQTLEQVYMTLYILHTKTCKIYTYIHASVPCRHIIQSHAGTYIMSYISATLIYRYCRLLPDSLLDLAMVPSLSPLNLSLKTWFQTSTPSHHSSPSPTPHSEEEGRGRGVERGRQLDLLACTTHQLILNVYIYVCAHTRKHTRRPLSILYTGTWTVYSI